MSLMQSIFRIFSCISSSINFLKEICICKICPDISNSKVRIFVLHECTYVCVRFMYNKWDKYIVESCITRAHEFFWRTRVYVAKFGPTKLDSWNWAKTREEYFFSRVWKFYRHNAWVFTLRICASSLDLYLIIFF